MKLTIYPLDSEAALLRHLVAAQNARGYVSAHGEQSHLQAIAANAMSIGLRQMAKDERLVAQAFERTEEQTT